MLDRAARVPDAAVPAARTASVLDVARDHATAIFVVGGLATWFLLLFFGRGLTFFQDEWSWIQHPAFQGHPAEILAPHNEHWTTLAVLVYRSVFAIFGLSTYLPYLGVLLALHLGAAAAIFVLVRRASGPLIALGAAALTLWAGTGWQNLLWAFQIGFIGSTAAGLWSLIAFQREGRYAAAAGALLLLASVMASGMGLVYCGVVGAALLADPVHRRRVAWLVPVGLTYAAWFVVFGQIGFGRREPISLATVATVPAFVWNGVADSVEATVGPIPLVVPVVAAALLLAPVAWLVTRRVDPSVIGAVAGLVVMYALIGLARGELGVQQAGRSRYLYEGVFLVVLAVGSVIGPLWARVRAQRRSTLAPAAMAAALLILVGTGLFHNVRSLVESRRALLDWAGETRAYAGVVQTVPTADWNPRPGWAFGFPTPDAMARLVAEHGDLQRDALVPGVVPPLRGVDRDRALLRLVGGGFTISTGAEGPPVASPVIEAHGATVGRAGDCHLASAVGPIARVTLSVPAGSGLSVRADSVGTGRVYLHRYGAPHRANALDLPLAPDGVTVRTPPMSDGAPWRVTLELPPEAGEVTVCGVIPGGA